LQDRLKKQKNQSVSKQYESQLRTFALTIHYYFPRAYEYVRSQVNLCLPHTKTISSWYRTINGNTGISTEALEAIKTRVKNTEYILYGSIQFDEMAIREHLEYDGVHFNGYIDITCVNSAWKIPLAYYFVKGISSDGTPTNLSVFRNLGCDFQNISSLQTSFPHPVTNDKIVAFLDPCHMLKLVRNSFGDMHTLIDINNSIIQWSHIIKLHELQENEEMHMGNKLRNAHVHYFKQKMKVRLAAQVFSKSVSDSLLHCKNKLKLNDFFSCEGTIRFLSIFNDLFDILEAVNLCLKESIKDSLAPSFTWWGREGGQRALYNARLTRAIYEAVCGNQHFNKPTRSEFQTHMREALRSAKERLRHKLRGPRTEAADARNHRRDFWSDEQPEMEEIAADAAREELN
ncbi:THAP domain-containing protein, partial [Ooceraea biroi]